MPRPSQTRADDCDSRGEAMGRHRLPAVLFVLLAQVFLVRGIDLHNLQQHSDEFHPLTQLSIHTIPKVSDHDEHHLEHSSESSSVHKYCYSTKCTFQFLRYKHNYSTCSGCDSVCKTTVVQYCHVHCKWRRYGVCRYCKRKRRWRKTWRRRFAGKVVRKDDQGTTIDKYRHNRKHYRGWDDNGHKYHYFRGTEYDRKGRLTRYNHDGSEEDIRYRKRHHQRQGYYHDKHQGVQGYYRASQSVTERHHTKKVCYKSRCRLQYLKEGRCYGRCRSCTSYCKKYKIRYCRRCWYSWGSYCGYCKGPQWLH